MHLPLPPGLARQVRRLQAIARGGWWADWSYPTPTGAPSSATIYGPQPREVRLEAQRALSEIYRRYGGTIRVGARRSLPELTHNAPAHLRARALLRDYSSGREL